ncbi:hypothetical protein Q3G72_028577 [Acer saccharum]|nr:hypothetical protein Q3G72_028577 [Acer saccharum]
MEVSLTYLNLKHLHKPMSSQITRYFIFTCCIFTLQIEGIMGNGKEHPSTLTPCSSNPSSAEFNEDRPNPQETKDCGSETS